MTTERDAIPPLLQPGHTPTPSPKPSPMIEKIRIIHLAGTTGEHHRSISQIFAYCEATPDGKPVRITPRYLESLMRFGKLPCIDVGLHSKQNEELDETATWLYRAAADKLGKTEALTLIQSIATGIAGIALFPDVILDRSEEAAAAA